MHINLKSISNIKENLLHYREEHHIDKASLNETWLKPKDKIDFKNYNFIRKDRIVSNGGGIGILVKKSLEYSTLNLDSFNSEAVGIRLVSIQNRPIDIISYYNPPHEKNQTWNYYII